MGMTIRIAVLLSALGIFIGCSSHHQALSPSDPLTGSADSVLAADSQNELPPEMPPEAENLAFSDETSTLEDSSFLDLTLGVSSDTETQTPEKTTQALLDEALEFYQSSQICLQKGEPDNALEALDQSYALILKVEVGDDAKLFQQKDDLRILISKRIQEIYTSRYTAANGNHNEIPMDLNEHVEKEIRSFQNREKSFFLSSYQRSGKYHDRIVKALEEEGMPTELSWLPLIESGFKVKALSSARALGLWQFIPSTGYKFGLKRDTYVDERLDPEKATEAAIAYLTELHQIFGDWMTVLAAYNCGEGRVLRVIRNQNVNYLDNFWDLYQLLPLETARYVPRYLATLHILNDPEKYGFELPERDAPLEYEAVSVNRQVTLAGISKELGVPETDLKALNPELRYSLLPAEPYDLRVPPGNSEQLLASIDQITVSQPPQNQYVRHRVRSGETLSTIASRYRTSVRRIMQANNLRSSNYIRAGKTLKIPLRGTTVSTSSTSTVNPADVPEIHTVRRGDSLWIIAKRYGTTVKRIQALNGLNTTNLSVGQRLKIKDATTTASNTNIEIDTSKLKTYVVKKGDSPFTIAQQNNTSLNRLLQLNHLSKWSTIYPGQTLYLD
jgi:membrane-bound lytic murein transglycosylase D